MGHFSTIDMFSRQGLDQADKEFVSWALSRVVDQLIFGADLVWERRDFGVDGSEMECPLDDMVAVLRAPVSMAAVIADVARELRVDIPHLVCLALDDADDPKAA